MEQGIGSLTIYCIIIYSIIGMVPIVLVVNFSRVFYKENAKKFRNIFIFLAAIFMLFFVLSVKFTTYVDSLFFLVPIGSVSALKIGFNLFEKRFKENLINTFTPFQLTQATKTNLLTHRMFNVLFVSVFCVIPLVLSVYLFPSKQFILILGRFLEGKIT